MFDAKIGDPTRFDFSFFDGVLDRSPRLEPSFRPTIRGVQEEHINIVQIACLQRLLDRLPGLVVSAVTRQLGCIPSRGWEVTTIDLTKRYTIKHMCILFALNGCVDQGWKFLPYVFSGYARHAIDESLDCSSYLGFIVVHLG